MKSELKMELCEDIKRSLVAYLGHIYKKYTIMFEYNEFHRLTLLSDPDMEGKQQCDLDL